jgi:DNA-binding IclR family transcriptional regulator
MRGTNSEEAGASKARRGIQSIEVGGQLLLALARSGAPMMLKDLAREAGMVPAKAHPYLVSFGKLGLIEQDPVTGRYELGRLALELGLVSLQRLDPVRLATPEISALAARVAQSGALAVWGTHGPTIVRFEESTRPIHVNLRTGTVMSLVNSATGQIFAAFLPPKMTESLIKLELQRTDAEEGVKRPTWKQIEATLSEVRTRGLARAVGNPIPGVNAFSAPVFDHTRNVVLAMTLLGPQNTFDADWRGPIARALLEASAAVSSRLGYQA